MNENVAAAAGPGTQVTEGERLLRRLRDLCEEHSCGAGEESRHAVDSEEWPPLSMLSDEDKHVATELREGLARLADALRRDAGAASGSLAWVLDGAQSAARNYLLCGREQQLIELLPSFAYLVVLQVSGPSEALGVAERATELLD